MQSNAQTVEEYLVELPTDRQEVVRAVRQVVLDHLPAGYEEIMQYGMIGYVVPLTLYPQGYLSNPATPVPYAGLASQKNYVSLYLMSIYGDPDAETWFREVYQASGKKLSMGKSCVRFKRVEDVPLDVIGQAIARVPVADYIKRCEAAWDKK